jgi:translation elongation factor EF-1beta
MIEKAIAAKAKKPAVIAKSIVLWDVKGYSDETDLDSIATRIFAQITQDGLVWKTEYRKEPLAFGVKKLVIGSVIEDEKVSTDDIIDRICEAFEDEVQSVDINTFNKL